MNDIKGQKFGEWTVLYKDTGKYKDRSSRWICQCSCGKIKSVRERNLLSGKSCSCGCAKKINYNGRQYGKLTVLETLYSYNGYNRATCKCLCECENIVYIKATELPKRKSCGCRCSRVSDKKGMRFGKLIVLETIPKYRNNQTYYRCVCDCGNEITVKSSALLTGNTQSCGCVHNPDLTGKIFDRLTVVKEESHIGHQRVWLCKCTCGNMITSTTYLLQSGRVKSCGCLRSENVSSFEVFIGNYLTKNKVEYIKEYSFKDCKGIGNKVLRFDFYLPVQQVLIEYDGEQHFKPIAYFGGEKAYSIRKQHDEIKNQYCKSNNIKLIRIPYTTSEEQLVQLLNEIIKNKTSSPVTTTVA